MCYLYLQGGNQIQVAAEVIGVRKCVGQTVRQRHIKATAMEQGQRTRTEVLATFLRNWDIPSSKLLQQPSKPISVTLKMKAERSPELSEQTHYPTECNNPLGHLSANPAVKS